MRGLTSAVVLGGSGFFGSFVADALAEREVEVVVVDSAADLAAVLADSEPDALFHLGGTGLVPASVARPLDDLERNAASTLLVLEAVRRLSRRPVVAFVSSAAVYGDARVVPMREDHPLEPVSPYGVSKLAAEGYVRIYARLYGLSTFTVRPFSLYGPRQRKLVVHDLLVRVFSGENPLRIEAPPSLSRDFLYVEDAAGALVTLAQAARAVGEAYNLASGRPTTLRELAERLVEASGVSVRFEFTGAVRPGDPLRWEGDASLARSLGATFDTPLDEGLRRTIAWFESAVARPREVAVWE